MSARSVIAGEYTRWRAQAKGVAELRKELATLERDLEARKQERDRLETEPRNAADTLSQLREKLALAERAADEGLLLFLRDCSAPRSEALGVVPTAAYYDTRREHASAAVTSALLAEAILARAERLLAGADWLGKVPMAERPKECARLDREIEVAEAKLAALRGVLSGDVGDAA
jgi:cell division septum initiation protein DivIVA